jgi:outer membrane lipoprotein-sorting protein
MSASTILTLIIFALALGGCSQDAAFDNGADIVAYVQRVQSDKCLVSIKPRFGGVGHLARLEGCNP